MECAVSEQLHASGRLSKFPDTLTYLRLPPPQYQRIDGRFFALPPNLLELQNYKWASSHPALPSSLHTLRRLCWQEDAGGSAIRLLAALTS
jgi:hypothetical protein